MTRRTVTCARCRHPRPLKARGLCDGCYQHEYQAGSLADWERTYSSSDDLAADYQLLRSAGNIREQIAHRLGRSPEALRVALWRLRKAGRLPESAR